MDLLTQARRSKYLFSVELMVFGNIFPFSKSIGFCLNNCKKLVLWNSIQDNTGMFMVNSLTSILRRKHTKGMMNFNLFWIWLNPNIGMFTMMELIIYMTKSIFQQKRFASRKDRFFDFSAIRARNCTTQQSWWKRWRNSLFWTSISSMGMPKRFQFVKPASLTYVPIFKLKMIWNSSKTTQRWKWNNSKLFSIKQNVNRSQFSNLAQVLCSPSLELWHVIDT